MPDTVSVYFADTRETRDVPVTAWSEWPGETQKRPTWATILPDHKVRPRGADSYIAVLRT